MILILCDSPGFPQRAIGPYRIAHALRSAGLTVEVLDFISHWPWDQLVDYIRGLGPIDWVGFSTKFGTHGQDSVDQGRITELTREQEDWLFNWFGSQAVPRVVGGPIADQQRPYLVGSVDWIVRGYADLAVLALDRHIRDREQPVTHTLWQGLKIIDADRDYGDWDLANIGTEFVTEDWVTPGEIFPIEIARGCRFKCAFCNFSHTGKAPGTYIRPMSSIAQDILHRWNNHGGRCFLFVDDTFNDSTEKMQALADLRTQLATPWEFWAYCRLDLLRAQPAQQDLVEALGWRSMTWGIETFNRASGSAVGKGADPERLKQFIETARARWPDNQFMTHIIVGLPNDTEETIRDTADWFIENSHLLDSVKFMPLMIYNNNDPLGRTSPQPMANDPGAWGYRTYPTEKQGQPWVTLNWVKKGMSFFQAIELAREQTARVHATGRMQFELNLRWPRMEHLVDPERILSHYLAGKQLLNQQRQQGSQTI